MEDGGWGIIIKWNFREDKNVEKQEIKVEVSIAPWEDDSYRVIVIAKNFIFFENKKDYYYRRGTIKNMILPGEFIWSESSTSFTTFINRYNYALQRAFINELHSAIYDKTKNISANIKNPFNVPKGEYVGYTMEISDKRRRDRELIKEVYEKKIFNEWYTKKYDDGEQIEVILRTGKSYNGCITLSADVLCDDIKEQYSYKKSLDEKFDIWALQIL